MLAKAGQTAGPNRLTFFEVTLEYPRNKKSKYFSSKFDFKKFHGQRRALHLVFLHNLYSYLDLDPGIKKPN